ncbi:MAG: PRC-barrel domain-containing protein [Syntrophomonadaceae bacterium]|jgi:uncharacterized protein YrrD
MKKTQEILGLPVFSIMDGKKIGQVKDLVINPEDGKVDFILVSNGAWYVGARVLPYKSVMGIGEHAVTTESEGQLSLINDTAAAKNLLQRNVMVKGNRVLTKQGNLVGVVSEFSIDEMTGKITRLEYKTAQDESKVEIIEADQVLTFGSDVIVIKERKPPESVPVMPEPVMVNSDEEKASATEESQLAAFFKQKQIEFLLEKRLEKDLVDAAGNVIIPAGTEITQDVIKIAEQNNLFVELSRCIS